MILLDTNILIELFKNNALYIEKIKSIGLENVCISPISVMEMYVGALNKRELSKIKQYLDKFSKIDISATIIEKSSSLLYQYRLSHSLFINDAILAASVLHFDIQLFTLNIKDFHYIPNIKLYL